jgi:TolB protein
MAVNGSRPIRFTDSGRENFHPSFSPDGRSLAFVSDRGGNGRHVWVAPIDDGRPSGRPEQATWGESSDGCPAWLPDGKRIVYVRSTRGESEIWLVDLESGEQARQVTRGADAEMVAWDPIAQDLLVSGWWKSGRLEIRHVSLDGGASRPFEPEVSFGALAINAPFSTSRDGRFLAWTSHTATGDVWVADLEPGSL